MQATPLSTMDDRDERLGSYLRTHLPSYRSGMLPCLFWQHPEPVCMFGASVLTTLRQG